MEVVLADVRDLASLKAMAETSRVVINCVGPFRLYGEPVVRACVENGAQYIDVSGEPEYIERTELDFAEEAAKRGVTVVSACGFDSIPADLGTLFAIRAFERRNGPGSVATSVEAYMAIHTGDLGLRANFATWESAVYGFASVNSLARVRRAQQERRAASPAASEVAALTRIGPAPPRRNPWGHFDDFMTQRWAIPFPGADASIVRRSQRWVAEQKAAGKGADLPPPVQFAAHGTTSSFLWYCITVFVGILFTALARFSWGRWLLLQYPKIFSVGVFDHGGPTAAQRAQTTFSLTFCTRGYRAERGAAALARTAAIAAGGEAAKEAAASKPAKEDGEPVITRVRGPDPGYGATSILLCQSALILLDVAEAREAAKSGGASDSASRSGGGGAVAAAGEAAVEPWVAAVPLGVVTTLAAFARTPLIERVQRRGVVFEVIDEPARAKL